MPSTTLRPDISSTGLKTIALVTMFIDHFAAVLLYGLLTAPGLSTAAPGTLLRVVLEHWGTLRDVYSFMRTLGRLAFPIYCFLLIQGFSHTRSVPRYALRLFVFALLSEIPFDLAFQKTLLEWGSNNVFFTLCTGLLTIWAIRMEETWLTARPWPVWLQRGLYCAAALLTAALAALLAESRVLSCDYGAAGVMTIAVMYLFRKNPIASYTLGVLYLVLQLNSTMTLAALLVLLPLLGYHGHRGRPMKYVFYAFYPLHLLLLAGIAALLGI